MRVIAVINQKGGCGKTTVSINLASVLAYQGYRSLLLDMDPQSHCSVGLAIPEEQIEKSIYDVLISAFSSQKTELKQVVWQISQNFDLAPSGIELAALEQQLSGRDRREECLNEVLEQYAQDYQYVLVDCPPSVGLLTFNALRAADEVIIPVETGYFAIHGLTRQIETLKVMQDQCKKNLTWRILPSMYDVRTKMARELLAELKKHYGPSLFKTTVNFNTKLKEAASFGQPITEYDSSSKGMRDFQALANEVTAQAVPIPASKTEIKEVEARLELIGKTADEIILESKELVGAGTSSSDDSRATVDEKLEQFYGYRQREGKVEFSALYPKAKQVQLAGDFNSWNPAKTDLSNTTGNGRWNVALAIPSGIYSYRYVVDGRWQQDPYNNCSETNPFGELNSVLEVL